MAGSGVSLREKGLPTPLSPGKRDPDERDDAMHGETQLVPIGSRGIQPWNLSCNWLNLTSNGSTCNQINKGWP